MRHPREAFREPRAQVADGGRGDRLGERVPRHRLPRVRVHVAGQGVFPAFGPRVRVSVEIEMDLGRWAKVDGSSQDPDFSADVSHRQPRGYGRGEAPRPIPPRTNNTLAGERSRAPALN